MSDKNIRQLGKSERTMFWSNHVKSWKKSNLTQSEYCRQHHLDKNLLSRWKTKLLNKEDSANHLVEIKNEASKTNVESIELIINNSITIKLPSNFDPIVLSKTLKVLGIKL